MQKQQEPICRNYNRKQGNRAADDSSISSFQAMIYHGYENRENSINISDRLWIKIWINARFGRCA